MKFVYFFVLPFVLGMSSLMAQLENHSNSSQVVYLKGTAYEMGVQHGKKLKKEVSYNIKRFVDDKIFNNLKHPQIHSFMESLPKVIPYIPQDYLDEMKGLAQGAQVDYDKVLILNLFPEMFHCTGLTVQGEATENHELYHVRVLDYSAAENLQDTAVQFIVQPKDKIPFINIAYAGFIGSVTGMNNQHIAIGEIGGKGYGKYEGLPMTFLLRKILENASSLKDVKDILTASKRTCEYYYVFSDGKTNQSLGVYATPQQLEYIEAGVSYAIFSPDKSLEKDNRFVFSGLQVETSPYQTVVYQDHEKQKLWGMIQYQPKDCLVLIGFCNPRRFPVLLDRLISDYGHIDEKSLQEIIKAPVTPRAGNLHNVIFMPSTLDLWISHAGLSGEPASEQPYRYFNLKQMLVN